MESGCQYYFAKINLLGNYESVLTIYTEFLSKTSGFTADLAFIRINLNTFKS